MTPRVRLLKIKAEKLKLVYANTLPGFSASLLNSAIVSLVLWEGVNHKSILIWLAVNFAVTFIRTIILKKFEDPLTIDKNPEQMERILAIGTFISGCIWGSVAIFLFPEKSLVHQVFVAFILGGMAIGAVGTYAASLKIYFAFCFPVFLPAIIRLYMEQTEIPVTMASLCTIFLVLVIIVARQMSGNLENGIILKYENADLIHRIASEKRKIEELNKQKDKLFSIIAHDLRSPVSSLVSISELLTNNYNDISPDSRKELIQSVGTSVSKLYSLLENLLEWSTAQLNNTQYTPEKLDFFHISDTVISLFTSAAKSKNLSLTSQIPKNTFVFADRHSLNSILRNLVSNAIKFTPYNGKITISHEITGKFCRVCVKDTGIGIHTDTAKKLFSTEINSTDGTNDEKGTGIGLMLCKEFAEKNGGEIWAESSAGSGSTFCFTIPLKEEKK